MAEYSLRVALTPQRLPDGRVFQYKPKTVEKWYQLYEKGGMEALIPRTRCDKGGTRVISDEAEREIHRLRKEYPRLNATKVCEKLVQDGTLPATVSVSTVQRYIVSDTKHTVMKRSACCDILYQNIHFLFILCSLSRQLSGNVSDQGRYASSNSGWFR